MESSRIPRIDGATKIPMPGTLRSTNKTLTSRLVRPSINSFLRPPQQTGKTATSPSTAGANIPRSFSGDGLNKRSNVIQKPNKNNLIINNKNIILKTMKKSPSLECQKMLADETIDLVDFDDGSGGSGFGSIKNLAIGSAKMRHCNETITLNTNGNVTYEIHKNISSPCDDTILLQKCSSNPLFITQTIESPMFHAKNDVKCSTTKNPKSLENLSMTKVNETTTIVNHRKSIEINYKEQLSPVHRKALRLSDSYNQSVAYELSPITHEKVFNSTMATTNMLLDLSPNEQSPNFGNFTQTLSKPESVTDLLCLTTNKTIPVLDDNNETLISSKHLIDDQTLTSQMEFDNDDIKLVRPGSLLQKSEKCSSNEQLQKNVEKISSDMQKAKQRFSLGLDLTECIADCSIDFCDVSITSAPLVKSPNNNIQKQHSFEMDESLGILTPDQMKEFLDSTTTTNTNPNLELPLCQADHGGRGLKLTHHQCRIDLTPSPEELPLDPVAVKTDFSDAILKVSTEMNSQNAYQEISQSDSDPKTEMSKSATSKVSASIITSITSITSLDTGYQGDGEMDSRPASRGADQSPTNCPRFKIGNNNMHWNAGAPIHRRQEPMTDSDFFTESDADDHRGDRRCAQVIDGQLYGPMIQVGEKVFIHEQPQTEDSCMESSGVFTDMDNRCDEDLMHRLDVNRENTHDSDMSPDTSTDTIGTTCSQTKTTENLPTQQKSTQSQHSINISPSSLKTSLQVNKQKEDNIILISDTSFTSCKSASTDLSIDKTSQSSNNSLNVNTNTSKYIINNNNSSSSSGSNKKYNSSRKNLKNETNLHLKKHEMSNRGSTNCLVVGKNQKFSKTKSVSRDSVVSNSNGNVLVLDGDNQENQENKRPPPPQARKNLPNKWDAVMNKIAEHKTVPKKSFYDVKSKVSCGVSKRLISVCKTSSTDEHSSSSNLSPRRAVQQSAAKRNRTHSKESQQSSASDLSVTNGSPKSHKKITSTTRSAKKRDVRTISSTPNDIGLTSSKANTTPRNQTTTITQKRFTQNVAAPVQELKSSPPTKKSTPRRPVSQQILSNKSPLPDHNRLANTTTTNKGPVTSSSSKLQQNAHKSTNSSNTSSIPSTPPQQLPPTTVPLTRNGTIVLDSASSKLSQSPPVINCLNNNNNKNNNNLTNNQTTNNQTTNKVKNGNVKSTIISTKTPTHYHHPHLTTQNKVKSSLNQQRHQNQPKTVRSHLQSDEQQQADLRNTIVEDLTNNLSHANKGVEALGVLVQYLVYNLDALSCPSLKRTLHKTNNNLLETKYLFDEKRTTCQVLEAQLVEKEALFNVRESELHELHRTELEKVEGKLIDLETTSTDRISTLEAEICRKEEQTKEQLKSCISVAEEKLIAKDLEFAAAQKREIDLLERISSLSCTENELREKVHSSELDYSERLQVAAMRERQLTDTISVLRKQVDEMKSKSELKERELEEKLNLSQDEIVVLRQTRSSPEQNIRSTVNLTKSQILQDEVESLRCVLELKQSEISDLRRQNQELCKSSDDLTQAMVKISALESRVEDVEVQLKAKLEEEKDLIHKQKQLQESYSQEVKNRNRLSLHNEELQWRLKQNSEKFSIALSELSKSYHDTSGIMNLSTKSINSQDLDSSIMIRSNSSDKSIECFVMEDVSPPTSPIIKGVVEKSDSVSWVLEMDDETPETLASRMVRRAGSFRNEKIHTQSPVLKRPKNQTNIGASCSGIMQSTSAASIMRQCSEPVQCKSQETSPRIRSKSVSVKTEPQKKLVRSNSNSGQSSNKFIQQPRNTIDIPSSWNEAPPLYSSSPLASKPYLESKNNNVASSSIKQRFFQEDLDEQGQMHMNLKQRHRAASFDNNSQEDNLPDSQLPTVTMSAGFHRDKTTSFKKCRENRGLITCDTKALTSNTTFDRRCAASKPTDSMCRSLPTMQPQAPINDLKKPRRPKMAAGEAMVSGSNSEDESISSDDYQSSRSSSSCASNSSARRQLSIEDVLLQKIVASLSGCGDAEAASNNDLLICDDDGGECDSRNETPMEVSWSEDGEPPSESIV